MASSIPAFVEPAVLRWARESAGPEWLIDGWLASSATMVDGPSECGKSSYVAGNRCRHAPSQGELRDIGAIAVTWTLAITLSPGE